MFVSTFLRLNDSFRLDIVLSDSVITGVSAPVCVLETVGLESAVTPGSMKNNIALFCLFIPGGVRDNDEPPARSPLAMSRLPDTPEARLQFCRAALV